MKEILSRAPVDVESLFIVSTGYSTETTAIFESDGKNPHFVSEESGGDGMVPVVSAAAGVRNRFVFKGLGNHMGLLENERVKALLRLAMFSERPLAEHFMESDGPVAVQLTTGIQGAAIGIVLEGDPVLVSQRRSIVRFYVKDADGGRLPAIDLTQRRIQKLLFDRTNPYRLTAVPLEVSVDDTGIYECKSC